MSTTSARNQPLGLIQQGAGFHRRQLSESHATLERGRRETPLFTMNDTEAGMIEEDVERRGARRRGEGKVVAEDGMGYGRDRTGSWLPKDHYGLVYIVFFLQGVGMLFPWNVFITAAQYFHVRLKGTAFQDNFENIFSFSYSFSNLIFMSVAVRWAHLPVFNMRSTVVVPQIVTAAIFAATTAMVLDDSIPGNMLFVVTALFVLVTGVTAALIQAGIFGLAGRFPSMYTQAVMSGQGVAGMTVSVISLFTALSAPCTGSGTGPSWHQIQPASFSYFLSSTIVILLTLVAFILLTRSDFAQFYAFASTESDEALSAASSPEFFRDYTDPNDGRSVDDLAEAMDAAMLTPRTRRRIIERRRSIMAAPVFQSKSPTSSTLSSRRSTPGMNTPLSRSLPKPESKMAGYIQSPKEMASSAQSSGANTPGGIDFAGRPPLAGPIALSPSSSNGIRNLSGNINGKGGVAALLQSSQSSRSLEEEEEGDGVARLTYVPGIEAEESAALGESSVMSEGAGAHATSAGTYELMDDVEESDESGRLPTCTLIWMIGRHCFSVCFVFLITLSVFPGITSEIRSSNNLENERCPAAGRFYGAGVWQAMFFLLFNGGDTVGRLLAAAKQIIDPSYVFLLSVARIMFVPLFLLCNVTASTPSVRPSGGNSSGYSPSASPLMGTSNALPRSFYTMAFEGFVDAKRDPRLGYFENDAWPIIFMCLLSISNGYVASLEMMNAPAKAPDGQQSRAGTNMAFFLVMGIFLGSIVSFPVRAFACHCNPFAG